MTEDNIEQSSLAILAQIGWQVVDGRTIGPDGTSEREFTDTVLLQRLKNAIERLNPNLSTNNYDEALRRTIRTTSNDLILDNYDFHKLLTDGVNIEQKQTDGSIRTVKVQLFDFENPNNNEFLAVNQLTIVQGDTNRRPDIVLFINGLPLVVIELKNATDSSADLKAAYNQIQTYKKQISGLFRFNELVVISDGLDAKVGTITAPFERLALGKPLTAIVLSQTHQSLRL